MSREFTDVLDVTILDMMDGEVTRVEIEGMDGTFVKAAEEQSDVEVTIDTKADELFEDGDKVRLLSGGGEHPLNGYDNGKTFRVDSNGEWGNHDPDKIVRIAGGEQRSGFAKPEQLELVEEEEDVELTVGSYAKFTEDESEHRKGEIVKIVGMDDDSILNCKLEGLDGFRRGWGSSRILVAISEEEVANNEFVGDDCNGTHLHVGDYVVGVTDEYRITNKDMNLGLIIGGPDEDGDMDVNIINHKTESGHVMGVDFPVKSYRFRKATKEEIVKYS